MNPCIVSIFMGNIGRAVVEHQAAVIQKFNKSKVFFYQVFESEKDVEYINMQHGYTMDKMIKLVRQTHDAIMFLDVDCIPLNDFAIDYCLEQAYNGKVIGDIQRSNHIENNQHVYAAGHNVTFTLETYDKIGQPTMVPSYRGDTAEELTYAAEEHGVEVELLMPRKYDAPPYYFGWEENYVPYWALADGMPNYGIGTTFANHLGDMFWHNYQICQPGQESRFVRKCEEILNG